MAADVDPEAVVAPRRLPRWRRTLVAILVVLGCVLAPLSVLGLWMRATLLDTDRYVDTVGPLVDDPDVQAALARRISNALMANANLEARVAEALPPQASFVAPAVASGFEQLVQRAALELVRTDAVETLWDTANRRAHAQVVALLEGEGRRDNVTTRDGAVVVRLGPLAERVQDALKKRGITAFDSVSASQADPEIVLIESDALESAQGVTDLLQKLAYVLPVFTLLAFAIAIWLSGNRRRTILRAGLGVALAVGLVLVVVRFGRRLYLDALPSTVDRDAARAVYDQVLSLLRWSLGAAFAVALIAALVAWLSGPSPTALRIRSVRRSTQPVHGDELETQVPDTLEDGV